MADETLTTRQAAELLGLAGDNAARAARVQMGRWGIQAVGRDTATGEKLWPADQVRQRHQQRPGRGARTDLRKTDPTPKEGTP